MSYCYFKMDDLHNIYDFRFPLTSTHRHLQVERKQNFIQCSHKLIELLSNLNDGCCKNKKKKKVKNILFLLLFSFYVFMCVCMREKKNVKNRRKARTTKADYKSSNIHLKHAILVIVQMCVCVSNHIHTYICTL